MKRKKITSLLLVLCIVAGICACGNTKAKQEGESPENGTQQEQEVKQQAESRPDPNSMEAYGVDVVETLGETALTGKTIYWLGASVTEGMAAGNVSMAEYIAKRNQCTCVKEAVSGTSMLNQPVYEEDGSVRVSKDTGKELQPYIYRMENGAFDPEETVDLFVIQITTNDCGGEKNNTWGTVTADEVRDRNLFDLNTTLGAAEYIVSYVQETWGCPVVFYTGAWFGENEKSWEKTPNGSEYEALINAMKPLEEKWGATCIDLFHNEQFNAISEEDYNYYMSDKIHPNKAGYLLWWTPEIEKGLYEVADSVEVTGGRIRGCLNPEKNVAMYKGIPYAAAPVGELRWHAPKPVEAWKGIRDCVQFGPNAVQPKQSAFGCYSEEFIVDDSLGYSEDCLTLNVWTDTTEKKQKPVVVYIHGGSYTSGGSSCEVYDGEQIAKKGVVFVSINYRLGIYGFLANQELVDEQDGAGNFGLLDMIQALQWVQDNIAAFGGDAGNVTIMGQSAGGGAIAALISSPKTEGLFCNAVIMSKDVLSERPKISDVIAGNNAQLQKKTLAELRAMSVEELEVFSSGTWEPCLDGKVLTADFAQAYEQGIARDVNLMIGMVGNDTIGQQEFPDMEKEERLMTVAGRIADAARVKPYQGNTYVYYFDYAMPGEKSDKYGAFHTSDVPYFLQVFSEKRADYWTETDYQIGERVSEYLVNFAATGNPNGEDEETWKENQGDGTYLKITED